MNDILRKYHKSNFLMHDSGERKNHKYIARVKTKNSDRWRYFYSQSEYQAYLKNNEGKIDESVEQTLNDDGSVKESTRNKYDELGRPKSSKKSNFEYTLSGLNTDKTETTTTYSGNSYRSETTRYTLNRGRNFIENFLKSVNGPWKKGTTYFSSGSVTKEK